MDTGSSGFWRRHGWTIAILLVAFGVAFFLRTAWSYPLVERWGALYTYGGGSDSYYHSRVMTYIIQTGHNLVYDPMLKFPVGSTNPREPLFDWMNAVLGVVFAPFFGGNAVVAGAWFLDLQAPLWAALGVFPIYLIGREVSGRRTGLIAVLIYPFLTASINSSTFGYANYLSFYTFVLLVVVYSFLRTVKAVGHQRYVESYRHPSQYLPGIRRFLSVDRVAVKWSVFTGVALGALALSWQGYTYAIVVIGLALLVAMIIERIRRVDSFGLYVSTWIIGLVAFPMAAPYYLVQHEYTVFLIVPVILFFGIVLLMLPFLLMRDVPWVFSIPSLIGIVVVGLLALRFASPGEFASIVTGQGYFVKTLIYSTVAEAQAPSIDQLVVGYGAVTFFMAFLGLALTVYLLVHHRFKRHHIAFLVYAAISIYLPVSATKFFLVGTPIFALLSAEAIHRALDVGGYPELRRTVASLSDRGGQFAAFRKAFKARHVLVLALVVGLLLPNMWVALDAGIPGNSKNQIAQQINNTIPQWLKLNRSAAASNYLGEAGSSLDTPNQYDSAAYNWLAQQDTNLPEPSRPAFVSWWDYGFQAIAQGHHPSVADNFQNGIDPAGQFLLSQNESLAIGILATTLLQGEIQKTHLGTLPASLNAILAGDGVDVAALHQLLDNEAADYTTVVNDPARYLPVNPSTLSLDNAMYLATSYYLAGHLPLSGVARVYNDLQAYTGWTIRYGMTDSRLFPFSGQSTGIFYAPADLTGRVINSAGVPTTFYNVTILGSDGNTYPLGPLPAGVAASQYNLNWSTPFYNTMLYRIYIGYNGTDVGQGTGIPGLSGAAGNDPIEPGWMLQHFEVVYRTAYVCPGIRNAPAGSACYHATNLPAAAIIANQTKGSADTNTTPYFQGGESMLAYYPGQTLLGTVALPGGIPVQNARVTVYDGWGIPHMSAVTAADGTFSLVLPPGNDTLNITDGNFSAKLQADENSLASVHLNVSSSLGYGLNAPNMVRTFTLDGGTVNGLVYYNLANNSSYVPATDPVLRGARLVLIGLGGGPTISAVTDPSGTFQLTDVPPQVYNVTVLYAGTSYPQSSQNISPGQQVNISVGISPGQVDGKVQTPSGAALAGVTVVVRNATGVVATGVSRPSGAYVIRQVVPGNYTVLAYEPGTTLRSALSPFRITVAGGNANVNLTVESRGSVAVAASFDGKAASSVAVRFVPEVGLVNQSNTPVGTLQSSTGSATLGITDVSGFASVALPPGPYSIYALGTVDGQRVAGVGSITAIAGVSLGPVPLVLTPAVPVKVTVGGPIGVSNASHTAVIAYSANGSEVVAWAGADETATMFLPEGPFSFAVVHGTLVPASESLAGLVAANVALPATDVPIVVQPGVVEHFAVGTPVGTSGFAGATGAQVVISAGPSGPSVQMVSGPNGSTGLLLPQLATGSTEGYCVRVSAFGFDPSSTCGWSSAALSNLSFYNLHLTPVPVTLRVSGLPPGTTVTVNLTAESPTAVNRTLVGGPSFSLLLPPGRYGVGARAQIGNGTTIYLPSTVQSTTIQLGATFTNLTLIVVPEINATGKLTLPPRANANTTTINLTSSLLNISVNATEFTSGFRATPANYTATISTTVSGTRYVNLTRVTIAANGSVTPRLILDRGGVSVSGALQRPGGNTLLLSTQAMFVGAQGIQTSVPVTNGTFRLFLPAGTYGVVANGTTVQNGPNGSYPVAWTSAPNATCVLSANATPCLVAMTGQVPHLPLAGTLVAAGLPTFLPGTVRLVGPYPSTNVTVVNATLGNFSASVLPGAYFVYAQAGAGAGYAGFARVQVFPGLGSTAIALSPTWAVTAQLSAGNGTSIGGGSANLTVKDRFGDLTIYPNVPLGSSVTLELPVGSYLFNATAPGSLNGIPGTARALANVTVANGNVGVGLAVSVPAQATVVGSIAGSGSTTVPGGAVVSFPFTVRASGNVPVTVHAVGSPASWNFSFTPSNLTLVPGGPAASGEARIVVPAGAPVDHPPVVISFLTASGASAGAVAPSPTITVLGFYGVKLSRGAGVQVGETTAKVPFLLRNSGNVFERVSLVVADTARLAGIGWNETISVANSVVHNGSVNLSVGANESATLNLTTNAPVYLPPGSVTLQATVVNASGSVTSIVTIPVPRAVVSPSPGKTVVTGPSVAGGPSSVPDWLVPLLSFVPAIALAVGLLARRWWKTRRWVRR